MLNGRLGMKKEMRKNNMSEKSVFLGRYIFKSKAVPPEFVFFIFSYIFKNNESTQNVTFYEHYVTFFCIKCHVV
jgi:hypothetical protein